MAIVTSTVNHTENPFVRSVKHFGLVLLDNYSHAFQRSRHHASLGQVKRSARVRVRARARARSGARLRVITVRVDSNNYIVQATSVDNRAVSKRETYLRSDHFRFRIP